MIGACGHQLIHALRALKLLLERDWHTLEPGGLIYGHSVALWRAITLVEV